MIGWIPKYTVKELKAIHNFFPHHKSWKPAGFQNTLSKNWKQFTTGLPNSMWITELDSKIHCQRTESNSQPASTLSLICGSWIPKYTVKELKAIHNYIEFKAEKNKAGFQNTLSKNWKQFTTSTIRRYSLPWLDSKIHCQRTESNSQRRASAAPNRSCWIPKYTVKELKAIHNKNSRKKWK